MAAPAPPYVVVGMTKSYFTRKVTGVLDYKGLPWKYARGPTAQRAASEGGWPGAIPAVRTPGGEWMWDSTGVVLHLEHRHPAPEVMPADPVLAFLQFVVEDMSDEFLVRPAGGTRWYFEENARHAAFEMALDMSHGAYRSGGGPRADAMAKMIGGTVKSFMVRLGFDADNRDAWVEEVLLPWIELLHKHFSAGHAFLLGGRPCLADFAVFGGHAAHFVNDPVCRRWVEKWGPRNIDFTQRLDTGGVFGDDVHGGSWIPVPKGSADVPPTLMAILRDAGRLYLPWAVAACAEPHGKPAEVRFASGKRASIAATPFLRNSRGVMLARYAAARCPALDAILDAAGILHYFKGYPSSGVAVPDPSIVPRPPLNSTGNMDVPKPRM